jgi:hypothetical protein
MEGMDMKDMPGMDMKQDSAGGARR